IANRDRAHLRSWHSRYLEHRHSTRGLRLDLDFLVIEFAAAQFFAKGIPCGDAGVGANQCVEHPLLSGELRAGLYVLALALAGLRDRDFDQIANDLLDVAADVPDLRELGGFDLDKWRAGELCQASCDLGFPNPGWPDHQNVFRQHFLAQRARELQAAPSVSQRDRDGALGIVLAYNEAVEFGNNFAGGKVGHWP